MRIAFVLLRTLGDSILGNTLVRNIKIAFPNSEIVYFIEDKYNDVVKCNPDISEVVNPKDWDEVLFMVSKGFDKVMIAQQTTVEDAEWHQVDKYRFGNLIDFYASRGNIRLIDRKIRWYNFSEKVPIEIMEKKAIFFHTTTLGKAKNWDRFGELLFKLLDDGYSVYQVGLQTDIPIGVSLKYDLRGKLKLAEIASILRDKCLCFVGLDSGLSFLAAAVGVPVICIMGASVPTTSGPWGENVKSLLSDTHPECIDKRCHSILNECKYGNKCINTIMIDRVFEKIKELSCDGIKI